MKISLLEPIGIPDDMVRELAAGFEREGHTFTYYNSKTTDPEELRRRSRGQDIVMIANNPYPAQVVEASENLKMIAVAFTGIDHVGLDACRKKDVMICNCAGYSNQSVAELAVGMTIELMRKLRKCDEASRAGLTGAGLMGTEIAGRTVGIVGCGQIGMRTAKLFAAFGARVLAYARHQRPEWKEAGIEYADLDTLLSRSDIVSLHIPLNESTRGFLSAKKLSLMKRDSLLINCARGPVVDNEALAKALHAGELAGAGIDVFDMEPPLPEDYPLLHAPNVLLTPHIAFATKESMVRRAKTEFANVYAYLHGSPENVCKY